MKCSVVLALALCCLVSVAVADYFGSGYGSSYGYGGGYVAVPQYGAGGAGIDNNMFLVLIGTLVVLFAVLNLNRNNTNTINLTGVGNAG